MCVGIFNPFLLNPFKLPLGGGAGGAACKQRLGCLAVGGATDHFHPPSCRFIPRDCWLHMLLESTCTAALVWLLIRPGFKRCTDAGRALVCAYANHLLA